jgi:hypothetical protein
VESSLAHRVRGNTPAFTAPLQKWSEFEPEGYPLTPSFLIASGNYLDARLVAQPYSGSGLGTGSLKRSLCDNSFSTGCGNLLVWKIPA